MRKNKGQIQMVFSWCDTLWVVKYKVVLHQKILKMMDIDVIELACSVHPRKILVEN